VIPKGKDILRARLKGQMDKKVLQFLSSLKDDLSIAEEDIVGTEAHNIMLFEQGILLESEIIKILTSLEDIKEKFKTNKIDLDETFEDIHPFIEKLVIDDIGIDIGGKIHTGRSRNDQVSVDIRLKIRNDLNDLSEDLFKLMDVLLEVAKNTMNTFVPLYTHLQRGQLGVFAHYINNYSFQITRTLERVEEVYNRVNQNPLGACAIGGTSMKISRKRTAELLGFEGVVENSIDAISSRDYILETLSCLSLISAQFSRMAEDLMIWSTKEFGFIELDDKYCSVSSVMPQKRNPDTLEITRGKISKIISNQFTALMITKAIPSGYFRDFQELKMLLKNSFELLISIITIFTGLFSSIKINEEKMVEAVNESNVLALDLAEFLVCEHDVPFRQSHEIVATLIRNSENTIISMDKDIIEKETLRVVGKKISLSEQSLNSLKDLNKCLDKRVSQGSPSKHEVEKSINLLEGVKQNLHESFLNRVEKVKKSNAQLMNLIKKLTS